jgi:hypothetical protein
VFVEKSDKIVDGWTRGYYEHMRESGMPFDAANMGKYAPLTRAELKETLYEFRIKRKSSPVMQLADLYLWPMSIGGYDKSSRTYARLFADKKLIDCLMAPDVIPRLGIKYSCWENVAVVP